MTDWMKLKLESRYGRNINNLRYADDTTLKAKSEEGEPLDEGKRGEWKSWL